MRRAILLSAPVLALAACGQPAPAPTPTASASPKETGYIAKVKALEPALLNGVLFRAINDSQMEQQQPPTCQQVKEASETPTADGQPAWVVTCQDRSQFIVALSDDGTARVRTVPVKR